MSIPMSAPSGVTSVSISGGLTYTPNSAGQINAQNADVPALIGLGFSPIGGPGNSVANFRNLIHGGDFTANPWQRNIAGLASGGVIAAAIANTPAYFPDRWFAAGGAAGSSILMAQVADSSVPGFSQSLKVSRSSGNANTAPIMFGQVVETANSVRAQGQQLTLSFWAKAGANFSSASSLLTCAIYSGTGANQSAASLIAGTWTGSSTPVVGTQALTTSMTRYSFTGNAPLGATELGVLFSWSPTGSAGADDSVSINGVQLEIGGLSSFEHRDAQVELEMAQRYAWIIAEPAAGVVIGAGMNTSSSAQIFYLATPVQFTKAPSVSVSAGAFKTNQAGTATATTIAAGAAHTPNAISIAGNSAGTAGQATLLIGGGGSGYVIVSADF